MRSIAREPRNTLVSLARNPFEKQGSNAYGGVCDGGVYAAIPSHRVQTPLLT